MSQPIIIERTYNASAEDVWELWTTNEGIESWWAPDGFTVTVQKLNVQAGGELHYTMTATAPEQVEFMQGAGMPLSTPSQKTFTEVDRPHRLGYTSLIDFVPGIEPYEHATLVELHPEGDSVRVVMTVDPLHDDEWTQRITMGRTNELDNLTKVIDSRA